MLFTLKTFLDFTLTFLYESRFICRVIALFIDQMFQYVNRRKVSCILFQRPLPESQPEVIIAATIKRTLVIFYLQVPQNELHAQNVISLHISKLYSTGRKIYNFIHIFEEISRTSTI